MKMFLMKTCSKDRTVRITELIAEMVATDMLPFCIVEKKGFVKFTAFLEPSYKIPCRKTISTLDTLYENEKRTLCNELEKYSSVSIGTDGWSSMAQDGYITYTAHSMSSDWILCTRILNTHALEGRKMICSLGLSAIKKIGI